LSKPLIGFNWPMICFAFSGLSQKFGSPILALSCSRWESLVAMSKRVPERGQAIQHLFTATAEIGVHGTPHKEKGVPQVGRRFNP
jgi:hypothetical protein